jgi:hypothetical protein
MELDKLKSQAYDCLANINAWQNKLKEINDAIANYKAPEVPKEEVKEE